jgi:hypothetical protein
MSQQTHNQGRAPPASTMRFPFPIINRKEPRVNPLMVTTMPQRSSECRATTQRQVNREHDYEATVPSRR